MRELLIKWLHEGMAMSTGEELYLPVETVDEQKSLYKNLRKELDVLKAINAEGAAKLRISTTYKDCKMWVTIKKINVTPLIAFKKSATGVERVKIENTRKRGCHERQTTVL